MTSLNDVVSAMSKESTNSTLGWDVVVNYSAEDLNKLLKTAHSDTDKQGQLKEIHLTMDIEDTYTGDMDEAEYTFQLGSPLIKFEALPMLPSSCQLEIPIIGGRAVVKKKNVDVAIPNGRYTLHLTGIALASINGTKGASRNPKSSDQPFVFNSPKTTGAVSLDFHTSAEGNRLAARISVHDGVGKRIPLVEGQLANLHEKIIVYFGQNGSSIHLDIAQVNNDRPSTGTSRLVPKAFQFACYIPADVKDVYTALSIFIQLDGNEQSGTQEKLQEKWSVKWSKPDEESPGSYGVPPIPHTHTASVIFHRKLIEGLVEKAIVAKGMKIEEIPKTSEDTFSVKWKVHTGKIYKVDRVSHTGVDWPYSIYGVDGTTIRLDNLSEPNGLLYLALGQNGEAHGNALMQWKFSYTSSWSWINGTDGRPLYNGTLTVNNNLNHKVSFDNNALTDYRVHLNLNVEKSAWKQVRTPSNSDWNSVGRLTDYGNVSYNALPDPPTFDLELFNIDFFMTTNLLLPDSTVINFKADPGVCFPRDLYLVGDIVGKAQVKGPAVAE